MDLDQAFDRALFEDTFLLCIEYAGVLLRESDLEDIAHYFEYTANDWARMYLWEPLTAEKLKRANEILSEVSSPHGGCRA